MLLLVHSPLLGPSSWAPMVAAAEAIGVAAVAPDLTGFADRPRPRWTAFAAMASGAASDLDRVIVVGHSGAGTVLPIIATDLAERLAAVVFVDAVVPAGSGTHETSAELLALLDGQTHDGRLAPWLEWWPPALVESLLPSAADRDLLAGDSPSLWRDTYDDGIDLPDRWTSLPCRYLQLSDAYDDDRARAEGLGWPTRRLVSTHLGLFTDPDTMLRHVLDLAAASPASADSSDDGPVRRFRVAVSVDRRGRVTVPVPFDPDEAWGSKPRHHVSGTVGGCEMRGVVDESPGGHVIVLGPSWNRADHPSDGSTVEVTIHPEGPQRGDLAPDIAAALDASPEAGAFFDSLAQFYRNAYLRWIDATKRRPDQRPVRIAEVISLLENHQKQRPGT